MKRILRLTALVVLGACLFAGALALQRGNQIRLESRDGRYRAVSVRTGNNVRIVRRLSDAGCVIGRSWGYDSNRIWVDNGCRAIFEYGGYDYDHYDRHDDRDCCDGHRNGRGHSRDCDHYDRDDRYDDRWGERRGTRRIRVESRDGRPSAVHILNRDVRLVRQLSDRPCREGRTWGHSSTRIWVDDGCRAEFEVRLR